jgi:sensor histidine kinase YesM
MEYDNDRIIKPPYKLELGYWSWLGMINPLINAITIFSNEWKIWPVLIFVNLVMVPVYFMFAKILGPELLLRRRYWFCLVLSILSFLILHLLLFAIYSLVLKFELTPLQQAYFTYDSQTIARESIWILVNMSMALAIFYIRKAMDERDQLGDAQRDNTFLKLRYLRAQLNPHFLFNAMNSIYSLSLQKSDKAPEVVVKLADIMRYLIYECNEEKVPLDKEIEFIRNYIEIEKIRYKADVRFSVEGQTHDIMIEPFLFISFIENGFKHALDDGSTDPFIYITLRAEEKQIVLNVINNSNADLETQAKRINGKGLTTSRSLLDMLYPQAYALDIIQTDKEENRKSALRLHNARERLEMLYPDNYTLDVILNKNSFTVSLIIKSRAA